MRVQILSDIHINHYRDTFEAFVESIKTDARLLVLAGDAFDLAGHEYAVTENRLRRLAETYESVIYVPGNHEFYDTGIDEGLYDLYALEKRLVDQGLDVWVPRPGMTQTYGGIRFIGATMWQPRPPPTEHHRPISDHFCIKDFWHEAPRQFADANAWFRQEMRPGDVVVTHHTPSYQSCAEQFLDSDCNRWFHTPEVEDLLEARKPRLWIHGHTHTRLDYIHQPSGVRVICNPRGYPREGVDFDPKLVVEL